MPFGVLCHDFNGFIQTISERMFPFLRCFTYSTGAIQQQAALAAIVYLSEGAGLIDL